MSVIDQLQKLRTSGGTAQTHGLPDAVIEDFAGKDPRLVEAIDAAVAAAESLEYRDLFAQDEVAQVAAIQEGIENFYAQDAVNPYVALAARGPWLVTSKGAVLHDSGGYGMLGFGHAPKAVLEAMSRPQVMANVMTSSFSQYRLVQALRCEIGHRRSGGCPFSHFVAMNSGSESVSVAARIADMNAKTMTDAGGPHAGKRLKRMSLATGFHGRTDRPAQFSDSTAGSYRKHLASFRDRDDLIIVEANDIADLEKAFERATQENVFVEAFFMEPVMGEGNPGIGITPEFYARARELTRQHQTLFLVDSIQAGLRGAGCLSIVDYPGFENLDAPDMETYSKALNAGQYPLSILAMTEETAAIHHSGVYGNTMTANPRAMDVGVAVLNLVTDKIRKNIVERGKEFVDKLEKLKDELDGPITSVQGTGLLFSCALDPAIKAYGKDSIEESLRHHGLGVIHGGENSLRFTPPFDVTSAEVDLIVERVKSALQAATASSSS